jgi:hypothetical protein
VISLIEGIAKRVNEAAHECENRHKADDLEKKLDKRSSDAAVMSEFKVSKRPISYR